MLFFKDPVPLFLTAEIVLWQLYVPRQFPWLILISVLFSSSCSNHCLELCVAVMTWPPTVMQLASAFVPWLVKISVCKSVLTVEAATNKLLKIAAISQSKMEDLVVELELYLRIETQQLKSSMMKYSQLAVWALLALSKVGSAAPLCCLLASCYFG